MRDSRAQSYLLRTLTGHSYNVVALGFSPDGATLASGGEDGNAMIWRVADGVLLHTILAPHSWLVQSLLFSADGATLVTAGQNQQVKYWNTTDWSLRTNSTLSTSYIRSLRLTPDGASVMAAGVLDIHFLRLDDGAWQRSLYIPRGEIGSVCPAPDQTNLLVGGMSYLRLVRGSDGAFLRTFTQHYGAMAAAYSPDGTQVAASSDGPGEMEVALYQAGDGALLRTFPHLRAQAVAFSPDGAQLATGSSSSPIKLWRVADGTNLLSFCPTNYSGFSDLAFSPGGELLGQSFANVLLWHLPGPEPYAIVSNSASSRLFISPAPARLALAMPSWDIGLWTVASGALLRTIPHASVSPGPLAFSPDRQFIASSGPPGQLNFWQASNGALAFTSPSNSFCGDIVAYTPDGTTLVTDSAGQLAWWRVSDGTLRKVMGHLGVWINRFSFSPDGRFFLVGRSDGTVLVARNPCAPALASLALNCLGPQPDRQFHFSVTSQTGLVYRILISTNLDGWSEWQTVTATNTTMLFADPALTNRPSRFYRAVAP